MALEGKKIGVLLEFSYEDLELWYPLIRLREEGADVFTIAPGAAGSDYKGKHGYPCKADRCSKDVTSNELDALVIPGGWAPEYLRRHPEIVNLVKEMHAQNKVVAAICHGPHLLCSARIINGVRVTSFFSIKDDLINAGGVFVDEEVVVDKRIITSRTPKDLIAFCRAVIREIAQQ